ncbi:MAG TPA: type II toxin-antitoxin system VapC family toxin [Solirubrobacterales bacterium]|nr:type II toxin-antitoxin system VapC family toxin [Solirubrobacterales bacterium]
MILDTSAVIAILFREKEWGRLEGSIEEAGSLAVGAPTLFETEMVAFKAYGHKGQDLVEQFLVDRGVRILPFDGYHWRIAVKAFSRYGKGRHPAALNYGDCMSYASAAATGQSLLFVGNDFARTDIAPA